MNSRHEIISVELADGTELCVEATNLGGEEDVAAFSGLMSFEKVTDTIESLAKALVASRQRIV